MSKARIRSFLIIFSLSTFISVAFAATEISPNYNSKSSFKGSSQSSNGSGSRSGFVAPSNMIAYGPAEPKTTVAVFTDLECGYCHKLHNDIPRLTELGIGLNIIAYPREGAGSRSYNTFISVWCSKDPAATLTDAMHGKRVKSSSCQHPIEEYMALGQKLGIMGTPTLVFADGTIRVGYLPPEKLAREAIKHKGTASQ